MRKEFQLSAEIPAENPLVLIKAASLTSQAKAIDDYLNKFGQLNASTIPIKQDDQILMIKIDNIIMADIQQSVLMIYSADGIYQTTETLKNFELRLNRNNFIQVSKHALINIEQLNSLSNSFSGNMTAKMNNGVKTSVSRKYVKDLMTYLGL